jgi:hypothetical protein
MDQITGANDKPIENGEERIIRGAEAVAEYIFEDRASKRKIYDLNECSKLPIFRLGSVLCCGLQPIRIGSRGRKHVPYRMRSGMRRPANEKPRFHERRSFLCRATV